MREEPAEQPLEIGAPPAEPSTLTRRELFSGASRVGLATALAGSASLTFVACAVSDGEPWQDETFWDDGTGWIE